MKQITFASRNHQLTNTNTDTGQPVAGLRCASVRGIVHRRNHRAVNVGTGEVEVIYRATHGAHVGVVTVHPAQDKYIFIHGPKNPDADWQYDFHHRPGA